MRTAIVLLAFASAEPAGAQDEGLGAEHALTDAEEVGEPRSWWHGLVCPRRCHPARRSFIRPRTNLLPELLRSIQSI